jgi:hypothetical protein
MIRFMKDWLENRGAMSPVRRIVAIAAISLAVALLLTGALSVATGRKIPQPSNSEPDSLAALERRIGNLESTQEPFMVVDRQGKKIFSVDSTGISSAASVFNSNERSVVTMGATAADGGYLSVRSEDGPRHAQLSAESSWAGLSINELITETITEQGQTRQVTRDIPRIELGKRPTGGYALRFPTKSGDLIAGIGESAAGSGAIIVGDADGGKRAQMSVGSDGKGLIIIFNAKGFAIAALGEAPGNSGGGLAIGDSAGSPRVKMGTNDNRYGEVQALPRGLPYVPKSGLPGSYMLGCAGGGSCVPSGDAK